MTKPRLGNGASGPTLDAPPDVASLSARLSARRSRPDAQARQTRLRRAEELIANGASREEAKDTLVNEFNISRSRAYDDLQHLLGRREVGYEAADDGTPLRRAREAAGLSRRQLDLAAGVALGVVSELEGRRGYRIGRERAESIAATLGVAVGTLFTEERSNEGVGGRTRPATPAQARPDQQATADAKRAAFEEAKRAGNLADAVEVSIELKRKVGSVLQLARRHGIGKRFRGWGAGDGALLFDAADVARLREVGPDSERSRKLHADPTRRSHWGWRTFVRGHGAQRFHPSTRKEWGNRYGAHRPGDKRGRKPKFSDDQAARAVELRSRCELPKTDAKHLTLGQVASITGLTKSQVDYVFRRERARGGRDEGV